MNQESEIARNIFEPDPLSIPDSENIITWERLYGLLAIAFPDNHPIHERHTFIPQTAPFVFGDDMRRVDVNLPSTVIVERLNTICAVLSTLRTRNADDSPKYSADEAYDAYSVLATNLFSLHGCLGVDGHGRAVIQLLPITLLAAGYPDEFRPQQFRNPETGEYDQLRAKTAVFFLNGHVWASIRFLAARQQMIANGEVSKQLLDPQIIMDRQLRMRANILALTILKNDMIESANKRICSVLNVPIFQWEQPVDFGFKDR